MLSIFEPCCEYPADDGMHKTTEECVRQGREYDPEAICFSPRDHHPFTHRVNLHRGEWSYIVLVEVTQAQNKVEVQIDATPDFIKAVRIAREHIGYRPQPKATRWGIRKGLAYGFIIDGPKLTATIVPTPRYRL